MILVVITSVHSALVQYLPRGKCEIIPDGIVKFSADAESEMKFAHNVRSTFYSEAISQREALFHLPEGQISLKRAHCFRNELFSGVFEPNVYFGLGFRENKNEKVIELQRFFALWGCKMWLFLCLN